MHANHSSARAQRGAVTIGRHGDADKRNHVERRLHAHRVHAQQERETQRQLRDFVREAGNSSSAR